jgi:hypothetical protein
VQISARSRRLRARLVPPLRVWSLPAATGLEAEGGSVWCRCHRFHGDFQEMHLLVHLLLHCNARHDVGDVPIHLS